jgi:APA family basic amino acid/polyamine antiporter
LERKLTLFDVTNLVVGAIVGADIYVASSFGARSLGPFSLVVWVIAGLMAMVIALCFAQCAALVPEVGGPYAYAKQAWGTFTGFIVGWSLWFAELISLAVFPVAFTQYLAFFFPSLTDSILSQGCRKNQRPFDDCKVGSFGFLLHRWHSVDYPKPNHRGS